MSKRNAIIRLLAGLMGTVLIGGCIGAASLAASPSPGLPTATSTATPSLPGAPAPSGAPSLVPSLVPSPVATASPAATPGAPSARPASPSPAQSVAPVAVKCGNAGPITLGGRLGTRYGAFRATEPMCVTELTLINDAPFGTGGATITLDGTVVYSIDLAHWDAIGVAGAGSGERLVVLGSPIGVARGQVLSLDYTGCSDCGRLAVWFAGNAP